MQGAEAAMTERITLADMHTVVGMMRGAAKRHVMPFFRCLARTDIRAKSGPLDIVTVADEAPSVTSQPPCRRRGPMPWW